MELSILNMAGQETGKKIALNDAIFAIEPNDHAIYLDVKKFLANNRQGTAKAKQRSEIAHSLASLHSAFVLRKATSSFWMHSTSRLPRPRL